MKVEPTFVVSRRTVSILRFIHVGQRYTETVQKLVVTFSLLLAVSALGTSLALMPSAALAAKSQPTPDFTERPNDETVATPDELERAKVVNATTPPSVARRAAEENAYFYKFRNSLSFRAGLEESLNDVENPGPLFGFLYAFPLQDLRGVEAGADLSRDGNGTIHFASRQTSGTEKFRWFYKLGGGIKIVASDQLVTFLRLRNWQARLSGGFEFTVSDPVSLRLDLDSVLNTSGVSLLGTLGVQFAW